MEYQILPGKVEFSYLPINAQAVVILPIRFPSVDGESSQGAVVVAANRAKVFKLIDLTRLKAAVSLCQTILS